MSTKSTLAHLAQLRATTVHSPEEVATLGAALLADVGQDKLDSAVLDQIAVAAIECGRFKLATSIIDKLPNESPRFAVLSGMLLEGNGLDERARALYQDIIAHEEGDIDVLKRLISLHLHSRVSTPLPPTIAPIPVTKSNKKSKAVAIVAPSPVVATVDAKGEAVEVIDHLSREQGLKMLVAHLDSVYNDEQGWAELASVYAEMGLYEQSLTALSHLILLAPQNPFHLLLHAETVYTCGQYELAYREMLRVVELMGGPSENGGLGLRAAIGAKLCVAKLNNTNGKNESTTKQLPKMDLLLTKMILDTYSSAKQATGAVEMRKWLAGR